MNIHQFLSEVSENEDSEQICLKCIGDELLQKFFGENISKTCVVCGRNVAPSISRLKLANHSRAIIFKHFNNVDPLDIRHKPTLNLIQVIERVTGIKDQNSCEMMARHLAKNPDESNFYDLNKHYLEKYELPINSRENWDQIKFDLIHRQRYFNKKAAFFFDLLIEEILNTKQKGLFGTNKVAVRCIPMGTHIYRARICNSEIEEEVKKNPATSLGAPPITIISQNRMNAGGIPLFYGAREEQTAIAEVRPIIGNTVAVGRFQTTRKLNLLDLTCFNSFTTRQKVSYWHDYYSEVIKIQPFLKVLNDTISQPIANQHTDYVITQAFTDYLRQKERKSFDGLIFRSAQNNSGINYAFFHNSDLAEIHNEPEFPLKFFCKPKFFQIKEINYDAKIKQ